MIGRRETEPVRLVRPSRPKVTNHRAVMEDITDNPSPNDKIQAEARRMAKASLMGGHTHVTNNGLNVHIYQRGGSFIARGRFDNRPFGETLGSLEQEAASRLRRLLNSIEDGSFVRPSESRKRPLSRSAIPRLTLRELLDNFLVEKRRRRGKKTAETYRSRLTSLLNFAELPANLKRWKLAADVDREFATNLRVFLNETSTTRNGRPGAQPKSFSVRQILNVLECTRTAFAWAKSPEVRMLPPDWLNPFTPELIGMPPPKDPMRQELLDQEGLIKLVEVMDVWQLCQIAISFVLPLRPEETAGLIISDVDFRKGWLAVGTRLGGADFSKGRQSFKMPFPEELIPILKTCVGNRVEGPLLLSRAAFAGRRVHVESGEHLAAMLERELANAPKGDVATEQDRKRYFRKLIKRLGGVSTDCIATEFKKLVSDVGLGIAVKLYDLRGVVTTAMNRTPGMSHLDLRYLTAHTTADILNEYVPLNPVVAMSRYFETIRQLLEAMSRQTSKLALIGSEVG